MIRHGLPILPPLAPGTEQAVGRLQRGDQMAPGCTTSGGYPATAPRSPDAPFSLQIVMFLKAKFILQRAVHLVKCIFVVVVGP